MSKKPIKPQPITPEWLEIAKAVNKWAEKYKGDICFVGSFIAFDKDSNVIDDHLIAYGYKDNVVISLEELNQQVAKSRKKFLNW